MKNTIYRLGLLAPIVLSAPLLAVAPSALAGFGVNYDDAVNYKGVESGVGKIDKMQVTVKGPNGETKVYQMHAGTVLYPLNVGDMVFFARDEVDDIPADSTTATDEIDFIAPVAPTGDARGSARAGAHSSSGGHK